AVAGKKPVVSVSAGAADAALARRLREILSGLECEVHTLEDVSPSVPEDKAVDVLLETADPAVFLLSGRPSLWAYSEIEGALAHNVPHVIRVVVGTRAEIPPRLEGFRALRIESPDELERLARDIIGAAGEEAAKRVKPDRTA